MPEWEGTPVMLPAFEAKDLDGLRYRTWDARQHHHLVVAFADGASPLLTTLASRSEEIRANNGELVVVCEGEACPTLPDGLPVVHDRNGFIASRFHPLIANWSPPVVFVADRYGELMAYTDGSDPDLASHVVGWLFSAEVQCSL